MRILVSGSTGLLGSTLVPYLRSRGYDLLCHSRKKGVEVCADLTDVNQVNAALNEAAPDVIINLAALTNVDECERNPQLAYQSNVRVVENLVKWIRESGCGCYFIHVSTDQVYDGAGPHREEDITLTNYYGFSKYAAELAAASVSGTILRTNFFGPSRCPGRISLSDWLIQSLTKGETITVFDDVHFSPLSLQRLVELVELVIEKRQQGVFNLGSKKGMSKADFAFTLADALDLPTKYLCRGVSGELKLTAYRPKDMRMNSSRYENLFDVKLPTLKQQIYSMKDAYTYETR